MKKSLLLSFSLLIAMYSFAQTAEELYKTGLDNVKRVNRVEAQENFNQAIAKRANYSDAYFQKGLLSRHFQKMEDAKNNFNKVVSLNKSFTKEAHFELGEIYFEEKKYDESLKNYSIIISSGTGENLKKAYLHRGKCYYYTKQLEKSINDFNNANALQSNDEAYFYLGLNAIETKDWLAAETHFNNAIKLNDKNGEYYLLRGSVFFSQADNPEDKHHHDKLKSALTDYDKALELDDKLEEAYYERGEVKMELSDYKGAIADFQTATKIDPSDLDAHYLKAMCNFHYGYEKQAKNELEDILRKDSKFVDAIYQLGRIELDEENLAMAIGYFDRLVAIGSEDSDVYLFRAYGRIDLGDKAGACQDFRKADELGNKEAHQKSHKYCK